MPTSTDDVFAGDLHGFLIYPASWKRPEEDKFTPLRVLRQMHARRAGVDINQALRFELAKPFGGAVFSSSYDKPDPLAHEQAVSKLFDTPHRDFLAMADDTTRRYLGLGRDVEDHFTHLHGIGSWENNVEPSMMTVFHRPVDGLQLQRIGADIGSWARQHGILAFSPNPNGTEQLLHMKLRTHRPMERMTQPVIANISQRIHDEFNRYFDPNENGGQSFWIPGRTILPAPDGSTDVVVWVPPWEADRDRVHRAFSEIGQKIGLVRPPTFWSGTGLLLGGTSPYSDEEAQFLSDEQKREAAIANYQRVLASPDPLIHPSVPVNPEAAATLGGVRRSGRRLVGFRDLLGRYKTRLSRADVTGLHRAISDNPHDSAPWGAAADALDEAGKSHTAHAVRLLATQGENIGHAHLIGYPAQRQYGKGWSYEFAPGTGRMLHTGTVGEIHGLPIQITPFENFWRVWIDNHSGNTIGKIEVPHDVGRGILHEIDKAKEEEFKPWAQNLETMKARFPAEEPQQFARSPAKTGAVVRGVYYPPGKMMPDVIPIQAAADSGDGGGILARIRKRFKRNTHASYVTTRVGNNGDAAGGGTGGSAPGAGGSAAG